MFGKIKYVVRYELNIVCHLNNDSNCNVFCQMCLILSLCVSYAVAPIKYAHLSTNQMQQFLKEENLKITLHHRKGKG